MDLLALSFTIAMNLSLPIATDSDIARLRDLLFGRSVVALSGAGCSTASGIPDYRGVNGTWHRRRPMSYSEFVRSADSRRYFWARNYRGWPRFAAASPNPAHAALAALEERGVVRTLITQNVDDLHQRAGQKEMIPLHGESSRVVCLDCRERISRRDLQDVLDVLNHDWAVQATAFTADADSEIDREAAADFQVAPCPSCGGVLKPDVVFFGESVERQTVARCMSEIAANDLLLVVGSSLAIWSGFRFAKAAHELGKPIVIINAGQTRADDLAALKIDADCSDLLPRLANAHVVQ